jgi:hypothetical protein
MTLRLVLMYADAGKNEDWRLRDDSHTKDGVDFLSDISASNCNSCRFKSSGMSRRIDMA